MSAPRERSPRLSQPGTTVSFDAPAEPPPMTEAAAAVLALLVRRAVALDTHANEEDAA
jgi:hypothetical protein